MSRRPCKSKILKLEKCPGRKAPSQKDIRAWAFRLMYNTWVKRAAKTVGGEEATDEWIIVAPAERRATLHRGASTSRNLEVFDDGIAPAEPHKSLPPKIRGGRDAEF